MNEGCDGCKVLAVRVDELEKRIFDRFRSDKDMREKLEGTVEKRLEGMNEFRRQLDRQAGTFVTWGGVIATGTFIAVVVNGIVLLISHIVTK